MRWTRMPRRTNAADVDGEGVWSWPPDAEAKRVSVHRSRVMGARKPGLQGERAISRNTIAQGRPDAQAKPVVTAASFFICWRAMGAACTRPSLRPLIVEGDADQDPDAICAAGMRTRVSELFLKIAVRHCEARSAEAIQTVAAEKVWIASRSLSSGRASRGPGGSQ